MNIILLGDSLFARHEGKNVPHINDSLLEKLPHLVIQNRAVSGDNSFDLLRHLKEEKLQPADAVFVFIGANDLATHKQVFLGEYQENLRNIMAILLKNFTPDQICLLTPAPVDEDRQATRSNRLVDYYSQIVLGVAEEYGCLTLDVRKVFQSSSSPLADILRGQMDDGLHFGSKGYELLAEALVNILTKMRLGSS